MATYREVIEAVRSGGSASRAGRTVRLLTKEEADPILIERCPSRIVRKDKLGQPMHHKKTGEMIVDVVAPDIHPHRLGFFDVTDLRSLKEFAPTDADMFKQSESGERLVTETGDFVLANDWEIEGVFLAAKTDPPPETLGDLAFDPDDAPRVGE